MEAATRALAGIRVVDFGQYIAGPLAAMLLADHGAEIVHIDPPGGPRMRTPANATWNRGKRCITLDLKSPLLARLRERLAALFLTRDAADWEDLAAAAAATPLAVCRTMAEWLETPHARLSETPP